MVQKLMYLPPLASAHGGALDRMTLWVHVLMLVLFVGWSIYFVIALMRFSAAKNPKANPEGVQNHASTYIEVGVIIAEAVLLLGFSIPLWAERVNHFPAENEAVVVHVIGQQFAWNIHYPGPDGKFGKPAIVHLTSLDVIHSFALQEMRVKQDAIPGMSTPVWFIPTVTSDDMKKLKGDDKWSYE